MWPRRPRRPKVASSPYSAYLRARAHAAALGDPEEAQLYSDEKLPLRVRLAWTIGIASKRRAPILSESEVARMVRDRLDLAEMVAQVESDDPGSSTPPAAPPPAGVGVEETARLHTTRWIGDPLPPTVS